MKRWRVREREWVSEKKTPGNITSTYFMGGYDEYEWPVAVCTRSVCFSFTLATTTTTTVTASSVAAAAAFLSRILCILALQAHEKHKEKMILFAFYTFSTHNTYSQFKIPSGRRSLLPLSLLSFHLSLAHSFAHSTSPSSSLFVIIVCILYTSD